MNHYQKGLFKITLFITLLIGLGVGFSIAQLRPKSSLDVASSLTKKRRPASVVAVSSGRITNEDVVPVRMAALDLECIKSGLRPDTESTAKQIRLKGKLCEGKKLSETIIQNRTNGFMATVFITQSNFTSDYLYLASGPNRIHMTHTAEDGEKTVSELVIVRK